MGLLISVLSYFSHTVTTVLAHTEFLAVLAEEEIMYKAGRRRYGVLAHNMSPFGTRTNTQRRSFGGSRRRRRYVGDIPC